MTRWRDARCGGLAARLGRRAALAGWVAAIRRGGDGAVLDLRDGSGVARVVLEGDAPGLTEESVVRVEGTVEQGPVLRAESLEVLSRAEELPFRPGEEGVDEETRLRHRWIDLRGPRLRRNLRLRARMSSAIREVLAERDVLEVETPLLGKPMPEGGREFVVATRTHRDRFFALPQSPQLHQLLLLIGGVERCYEIARCFRDEPVDEQRLQEFSQLSVLLSFPEPREIFDVFEDVVARVWRRCLGVELETPFPRLEWREARRRYGTDRPDLRSDHEAWSFVWITDFPLFVQDEEGQVLVPELNPMTAPAPESVALLDADPGRAVGSSFDLVCNGVEIGTGSSGIDRHDLQVRMLEIMGLEPDLQRYWIGPLLDALRAGAPPHEGAGLGLDRIAMLLAGERTVREVVAFPQDASGHDRLRDSPSAMGEGKLAELGLTRSAARAAR